LLPVNTGRKTYTVTGNNLNSHTRIPIYYLGDIDSDMLLVPVYEHAGLVICVDINNRIRKLVENITYFQHTVLLFSTNDLIALSTHPVAQDEILVFQE